MSAMSLAQTVDVLEMLADEIGPATVLQPRNAVDPIGLDLVTEIVLQEALAGHLRGDRQAQQLAFELLEQA